MRSELDARPHDDCPRAPATHRSSSSHMALIRAASPYFCCFTKSASRARHSSTCGGRSASVRVLRARSVPRGTHLAPELDGLLHELRVQVLLKLAKLGAVLGLHLLHEHRRHRLREWGYAVRSCASEPRPSDGSARTSYSLRYRSHVALKSRNCTVCAAATSARSVTCRALSAVMRRACRERMGLVRARRIA